MNTKEPSCIFHFQDYKIYLKWIVEKMIGRNRGVKTRIAQIANIHSSYLTKVLAGEVNLTLEQAYKISKFFNHSHQERKYFLFLLLKERTTTPDLRDFFQKELSDLQFHR